MENKKADQSLTVQEKKTMGRATWHLLHTIAKYYPRNPTPQEKKAASGLIESLSILYPCPPCASSIAHFHSSKLLNVESQPLFALSLCEFHNFVNLKIGKPLVDCHSYIEKRETKGGRIADRVTELKASVASVWNRVKALYNAA
ncbi:mitochondrial FAD-linked sulfhydryl oxidase [Nematocida major]|uniref:mitochondrial FAD-linked sulfhydryl oxidase n=1 Tax=Nematocida major TaxID=1912982 RepID=UPI00200875FD|nr:mitochondrial FAD-linked sulfhydryl oxidase [Nematocida major]KAH9385493.1 mitochondrial FAD-linked sulfhydryl oxidase [Nematocida major]